MPTKNSTAPVYWITGLSGSGKSTLGELLYQFLQGKNPATVYLDGDILRQVYGDHGGHDLNSRKMIAGKNARLCKLLSDQGIQVVIATISLFHEVQQWNRANIENYTEIFLNPPQSVIEARCSKGLYQKNIQNMVGKDLKAEYPLQADLTYDTSKLTPQQILDDILSSQSIN